MKRVLAFLAVATAILAVSCNKELQGPMSADKNTVTFTVNADQLATRAVTGTHGTANRLQVGVYLKSGETFSHIAALQKTMTEVTFPATVSLDLARNETYKIVFWADEGTDAYTINWTNGTVAETATTIGGNLTNRDAFYKMVDVTPTGSAAQSVTLVRPLAQINVGTNDLASYKAAAAYTGNIETQVVVTGVAPGLNLLSGAALSGEAQTLTFTQADNLSATLTSGDKSYDYLALNYVLCPADNTLTAAISIRKDDATDDINAFTVSNMPVKPNYRTNVVGKLLTGTVEYTVDVDANFADDLNKQVGPIFASVKALNDYFETMADNSDNGDIVPEVVTLSASATMGANETIKLPKIATKVVIRVNAKSNGKLTFKYGDGAGADEKPAYVDLFISHVNELAVDLDDSHVELLAYSSVGNIVAATGPGTFVIQQGAKVGTVEIEKGNAEVSGEVHQIHVIEGATADGENPVKVFLNKESGVDEIVLNAKTNVVVEQPKDHIDVDATEKKVAVYVKEGANNSTATAQNGGVIYVKAEVPCSVTADGTSEAEDGTLVSSTVIIESGAAGSSVAAENGGAINLTANDDCEVSAAGTSTPEDPTSEVVPSSVTIDVVGTGADVDAVESQGGEIVVSEGVDDDAVDIKEGVALIGKEVYTSLADAVAAAESGATITLIGDDKVSLTNNGEIEIDKPLTITGGVNTSGEPLYTVYGTPTYSSGTYNDIFISSTSGTVTISNINFREFSNEVASSAHGRAVLFVGKNNTSSIVIENVYISEINTEAIHINGGSFAIDGCLIDCDKENPASGSYSRGIVASNDATGSITNTAISNVLSSNSGSWTAAIELLGAGPIAISGCTLGGDKNGYTMGIAAGAAGTITPGTSSVTVSDCSVSAYYALFGDGDSGALITVSSGEYEGILCEGDNGTGLTISGGKYSSDPADFLADGLEANLDGDGWWVVGPAVWSGAVASDEQFNASVDETAKTVTVSSTAVLAKLAANVQAGNDYAGYKITLTKDLDLNNEEWTPIGGGAKDSKASGKNFAGEFDGGGHTVSNLKITRGYSDIDLNWRVGFIGSAIGAKVHDLTIHNANVIARGEVAAAVGYNAYSVEGKPSEIYNVNVTGHVVISAAHRGAAAICGYSNYYVHECTVDVDETSIIDGFWASGGIVGFSPQSGDIKNNYSNIKVVSDYACGGIVGLIEDSVEISGNTVENTSLQASADYGIGGLIGMMNYGTGLKIKNNTVNNVVINATENVAGVIGAVWEDNGGGTGAVEITNNTLTGITINSSKGAGTAVFIGFMDAAQTATISGNSFTGTITTGAALVNDGIWAGVTDPSNVTVSENTVNLTTQVVVAE